MMGIVVGWGVLLLLVTGVSHDQVMVGTPNRLVVRLLARVLTNEPQEHGG
jgi:hypothetical protein